MKRFVWPAIFGFILTCYPLPAGAQEEGQREKRTITALYVSLADHYAGIVAYEKYRREMVYADYTIKKMGSWPELRAYFMSGRADVAFIVSPMAMDMFLEDPKFRWVSLMHRDGNALAINGVLAQYVKLHPERIHRKPTNNVSDAFARLKQETGHPIEVAVPSFLSTHAVILYKYLKDHNLTLGLGEGEDKDVVAVEIPPPKSPAFIKKKGVRGIPASFEQSLPWADVVETQNFGQVAWYSKDVLVWPKGHVECIIIASDEAIKNKREALKEVIRYIHQAGMDIEQARTGLTGSLTGASDTGAISRISEMIRKHVPEHNTDAIIHSLRKDLNVINYKNLNVDKGGMKQIMNLAVEAGILSAPIDIDRFADESFSTSITADRAEGDGADYLKGSYRLSDKIKRKLNSYIFDLEKFASSSIIIEMVKAQNDLNLSLDRIKEIDYGWVHGQEGDFQQKLLRNSISLLLKDEILAHDQVYAKMFLCDRAGALIGLYPLTTDYWKGDEEKFINSFNGGDGRVLVGDLKYDKSTESFLIQVSVPVKDGDETIGVLVAGIHNDV